jgi:membrane associated rhomboid family serine protease
MLPYRCDAPIYYLPIGTVSLIIANVVVFLGLASGHLSPYDGWALEYGTGLHAEQWLLSIFAHAGPSHLLGNMFFLWVFELMTEGKLGWHRFLPCYFLIGAGQSAVEQIIFSGDAFAGSYSLGASAAIFGLMAMACVWAPMNEVSMFCFLFFRVYTFEVTIGVLAACYVGLDLTMWLIAGGTAGSSLLHLMGVVAGAVVGVVLLKRSVVDCEDWDLFAVFSGTYGPYAAEKNPHHLARRKLDRANSRSRSMPKGCFALASNQINASKRSGCVAR